MKEKLLTLIVKFTFAVFKIVPHALVIFLGKCLGCFLSLVRFKKKLVLENLEIVYGDRSSWPQGIEKRIYRHFGILMMEMLKLPSLKNENFNSRFHLRGREHLDKALNENKGAIVVTGHTGNWEYGIAGLASSGYTVNVIVKKLKNIDNDYVFAKIRGEKGVGYILKEKAVLNIRRALKKNEIVVMVIDQNSKRSEGAFVEHFGRLASTYAAPYVLANRFKCPVLPIFCHRDENLYDHHIEVFPEIEHDTLEGDEEGTVKHNIRKYLLSFEKFLSMYPEQWIWMHRRWRTQPKDKGIK